MSKFHIYPIAPENRSQIFGCSYKGYIVTGFHELVDCFGYPNNTEPSADGKVQFEWILMLDRNRPFVIYPWKNNKQPWLIERWHIGCHGLATYDFIIKALGELGFDTRKTHRVVQEGT